MSKSGTTATFKYNSEGLRVQKTVNGTVTNYTLHGKNIVHMIQGSNTLHFWYDANNRPAIVQFNGTKYAYIHNLQGDIVGILNASGTEVVKYTYDAWGKVISTTGSLASTLGTVQPFRYRGYVYDVETGLYYLRSRYYNPGWIRFVNKDDAGIINNNGSLSDVNLYAYCDNEPIVRVDEDGKLWLITALVSAVVNIAVTFVAAKVTGQDYTWADAGVAAAAGIANTIPLAGPALNGVITGGYTAYNAYQKGASLQNAIISGVVSGCASGVSIGNLSGFMGTPLDLATSAAADLTFGSGYNIVASSVYASVTTNEPRPIKNNLTTDGTFMPEPSKRKPGKPINKTDFNMIMLLE